MPEAGLGAGWEKKGGETKKNSKSKESASKNRSQDAAALKEGMDDGPASVDQ